MLHLVTYDVQDDGPAGPSSRQDAQRAALFRQTVRWAAEKVHLLLRPRPNKEKSFNSNPNTNTA